MKTLILICSSLCASLAAPAFANELIFDGECLVVAASHHGSPAKLLAQVEVKLSSGQVQQVFKYQNKIYRAKIETLDGLTPTRYNLVAEILDAKSRAPLASASEVFTAEGHPGVNLVLGGATQLTCAFAQAVSQ